ncbi:MAG: pyridoxamine 5'-phosphate oxidase family protein [Rubrivivax sp.]|nr:pyridoxamine 5'-phosphate oxidase family protein [Rubrivivax sp.]
MSQPARLSSLPEIEAAIWRELAAAIRSRGQAQHGWRLGVLATVDGEAADARSVVLRDIDAAAHTLLMYTDARSPKAQQLVAHPQGTLVLWSAALGWQLRLRVLLSLQTSGLQVSSRWAQLKLTPAAQDYLSPLPPGTVLGTPVQVPAPERQSRGHFAVLTAQVQSTDWLELHTQGHRRARFTDAQAVWVTP